MATQVDRPSPLETSSAVLVANRLTRYSGGSAENFARTHRISSERYTPQRADLAANLSGLALFAVIPLMLIGLTSDRSVPAVD